MAFKLISILFASAVICQTQAFLSQELPKNGIAMIMPAATNGPSGVLTLQQDKRTNQMRVSGSISSLTAGATQSIQIREKPCSAGLANLGNQIVTLGTLTVPTPAQPVSLDVRVDTNKASLYGSGSTDAVGKSIAIYNNAAGTTVVACGDIILTSGYTGSNSNNALTGVSVGLGTLLLLGAGAVLLYIIAYDDYGYGGYGGYEHYKRRRGQQGHHAASTANLANEVYSAVNNYENAYSS